MVDAWCKLDTAGSAFDGGLSAQLYLVPPFPFSECDSPATVGKFPHPLHGPALGFVVHYFNPPTPGPPKYFLLGAFPPSPNALKNLSFVARRSFFDSLPRVYAANSHLFTEDPELVLSFKPGPLFRCAPPFFGLFLPDPSRPLRCSSSDLSSKHATFFLTTCLAIALSPTVIPGQRRIGTVFTPLKVPPGLPSS